MKINAKGLKYLVLKTNETLLIKYRIHFYFI